MREKKGLYNLKLISGYDFLSISMTTHSTPFIISQSSSKEVSLIRNVEPFLKIIENPKCF